jgi:hypothetical protein
MSRPIRSMLLLSLLVNIGAPVWADDGGWEYQVVILQGITAGGTIEKQASGVYVDTKRTGALNELAAEGWVVVSVIGAPGADHTVYLRRKLNR